MKWLIVLALFCGALSVQPESAKHLSAMSDIVSEQLGENCTALATKDDLCLMATEDNELFVADETSNNLSAVRERNAMVEDIQSVLADTDVAYATDAEVLICTETYVPEIALYIEGKYNITPIFLDKSDVDTEMLRSIQYSWSGIGEDWQQVQELTKGAKVLK